MRPKKCVFNVSEGNQGEAITVKFVKFVSNNMTIIALGSTIA